MTAHDITVVFFDIDGTLVDMQGAGRRSFIQALESVFGWQDNLERISFAGATDLQVFLEIMNQRGRMPSEEETRRFFARLPHELSETAKETKLILFPGVRELLTMLDADPRVLLGLVTGNVEECARIKLQQFNLHGHFILGAFGHEHADRSEIAVLALNRALQQLKPHQTITGLFLIGDTPSDVKAARTIGATSIAVATGKYDGQALKEAGANHVLKDLSNTEAILGILNL